MVSKLITSHSSQGTLVALPEVCPVCGGAIHVEQNDAQGNANGRCVSCTCTFAFVRVVAS